MRFGFWDLSIYDKMSTIKALAGQTAIYGVSSILGRLLNYLLVPLHTHKEFGFNESDYGVISEFYAYVAFFVVLLTFGMETTFFRFVNRSDDKEKTFNQAASIVIALSATFFIITVLFSKSIASWMGYPDFSNFVIWFGAILSIDAVTSLFLAKLRFKNKPRQFAIVQLSSILVNILFNVIFIFGFWDNTQPEMSLGVGFIFLANLIASLIKPVLLYREILNFRFIWDNSMVKTMFVFALPLTIAGFAGIINETVDRILIKRLLMGDGSPESLNYAQSQVGIYSAVYKLSIIITMFIQAFRYAAEPFFFAQEKNKDKSKIYSKVMTYFVMVVSLIFLIVTVYIDVFKWFIPNEAYWVGLKVVPILLLANVFLGIYYNQSIWYKLADKTRFGAYIAIGGALVTLIMNYALIPVLGYVGSAWATFTVYFLMMVTSHILGQKHYPIKYNLRKVFAFLIGAVLLFGIDRLVTIESSVLSYGFKTILVGLFIGLVFFIENPMKELGRR